MAELEMLPVWAGRLAEPSHPPQPPTPPRRYANDTAGEETARNGDAPSGANGDGPAVLAGQPPLPSGEHRLEPEAGAAAMPASGQRDDPDDDVDDAGARAAAETTSELPVVSIPFDDETLPPPPEVPAADDDSLIDTLEAPAIDAAAVAHPAVEHTAIEHPAIEHPAVEYPAVDDLIVDAELMAGSGQPPTGADLPDEIVYESDEIELLEDTDPIGPAPDDNSPMVAPVVAPGLDREPQQGRRSQEAEQDRPALRVLSLLALALVVVGAGVAAGYLFVALTGG